MLFVAENSNGERIEYRDTKRHMWWLAYSVPLMPVISVWLYLVSGQNPIATLLPLVFFFVFIPLLDFVIGEDVTNPPPEIIELMEADRYYSWLLYLSVPLFWLGLLVPAWLVGTHDLPWWAILAMAVGTGYSSGTAITVGHELGHKLNKTDRVMAILANAVSGYGHFCIEHNRGHHTWVATPEDCSSARFNESVYAFALRDSFGALVNGWRREIERMRRKGRPALHWSNEILQGYTITLVVALLLIALFGPVMIPFLLIQYAVGWYALSQANYVEHYGLKRQKLANGRYEQVQPHHSWNTNHLISNVMLFHLQRHSDHHANPLKPYQGLLDHENLPRLPSGYPGCFVLTALPPLWRRIMNPKVLKCVDGDVSKVNTGQIQV